MAVPSAPAMIRATTILLLCAAGLAACKGAGLNPQTSPEAPSAGAVAQARYATSVDLDNGGLLVTAPPAGSRPTVSAAQADAMFEATDAVQGRHTFSILGLGLVTVAARAERTPPPSTTTTSPPPPSTVPPTTAPPPPPTTTTPPPTTTPTIAATSTSTSTSTTAPAPAPAPAPTTAEPVLPSYRHRLAWVGIVWGAAETCTGSTTTHPASAPDTTYIAVLIDARTGHQVLVYRSGGRNPCGGGTRSPRVTEPNELLSVAWQPVGPSSTAVRIQIPACGRYYGWTQIPTTGTGIADQVVVAVPFDPRCGSTQVQSQLIDQVVPLGPGQTLVGHAVIGPIRALQTLPTS